jgi:hypothetical protein
MDTYFTIPLGADRIDGNSMRAVPEGPDQQVIRNTIFTNQAPSMMSTCLFIFCGDNIEL